MANHLVSPNWKKKTPRDKKYLAFIRTRPCVMGGGQHGPCLGDIAPHHTESGGAALKGSDYSCVPLCTAHHKVMDNAGKKGRGVWTERQLGYIIARLKSEYISKGGKINE